MGNRGLIPLRLCEKHSSAPPPPADCHPGGPETGVFICRLLSLIGKGPRVTDSLVPRSCVPTEIKGIRGVRGAGSEDGPSTLHG